MCFLTDQFLFVTGSYLKEENYLTTTERYDVELDRWAKYPPLTVGRSFHSSCGFEGRYVFVFCGMEYERTEHEVVSKEDHGMTIIMEKFHWTPTASIERLDSFKKATGWQRLEIPNSPLTPRKNPGVL